MTCPECGEKLVKVDEMTPTSQRMARMTDQTYLSGEHGVPTGDGKRGDGEPLDRIYECPGCCNWFVWRPGTKLERADFERVR